METNYKAPQIEVIEIEIEGAILTESVGKGSDLSDLLKNI